MKDDQRPPDASDPLPAIIRGLNPGELFARGMQTVKMSGVGSGGGPWTPPRIDEMTRLFPGYEILTLLGHGGMGAVYKARQISLDRIVAIKLLPLQIGRDREFTERFTREAQTMARLHHPNLVALYNFGQTPEGHLFFVMEYVEGATLHDLAHTRALTPARVIRIMGQVCEGLASAHREGVVHRDIKPPNILVDVHGVAKVADFGLARSTKANSGQTLTIRGMVVGTLDYMAPEQRRGERVDQNADIYALGVVLYEALTGQLPRGVFPPVSQLIGTPHAIDEIISRAMQQDPAKRFQSAMELKLALDTAPLHAAAVRHAPPLPTRVGTAVPSRPPGGEKPSADRWGQRSLPKPGMWIAIAAAVVVVSLLGYALMQPSKSVRTVAPHYVPTPAPLIIAATPAPKRPVAVVKAAPATAPKPAAAATPSAPLTFGDSRYQFIRSQASWMQAKTEAEFKGGHLATITTKEEAEWIRKTFGPELPRKWSRIWIGAYQADRDDTWHWVTDEEFKFSDWIPSEPNGAKTGNVKPPFCAGLSTSLEPFTSNGWDDTGAADTGVVGYLVEWDEPKTAPPAAPVAMTTPAPAPAAPMAATPAPAVDEAALRLTALKAQYDAAYARDIAKTFDAGRDMLQANYQAAIDREIAKAAQSGKFADTVALREERVRASLGKGLDSNDSALPEVLKPLRASYRTSLAKLETDRAAKLKPIRDGYLKLLDAAQAEFTRAQKVEFALAVQQRRDAITGEWTAETGSASAAKTESPMSLTGAATDAATSSWRRAALLALRFNGRLEIRADGRRQTINIEGELPAKRYEVMRIDFIDVAKNAKLTDADLTPLVQCKELDEFKIERAPVTAKGLEVLRGMSELKALRIYSCPQVNDQATPAIGTLANLTQLELTGCAITKEGLKNLARCTKLRRLNLSGQNLSAAGLGALAQLPIDDLTLTDLAELTALDLSGFRQLKTLVINSVRDAKARVLDTVSKLKSLESLRLGNSGLVDDDFAKLAGLSNLKGLELDNGAIRGPGLASLRSCRSFERLRLANCGLGDAALETIGRDLSGLRVLAITGANQVQGSAFRALGKSRTLKEVSVADGVGDDAVAAELSLLSGVEVLNFNGCPQLSDTGLESLSRLKSLKRVALHRCTKLTDAGVAAFRKARPDVTVERDVPKPA